MNEGIRIYNLFPLLAGPVERWRDHLPRIQAMGFDWVYVNPFHYPGFSGSLYAIKDPARLHPVVEGGATDAEGAIRAFVEEAGRHGLKVMIDFVINHTAIDADLVQQHPEWYRRDSNGEIYRPRAVSPDTGQVTIWGDLAELDFSRERPEMVRYFTDYLRRMIGLGVRGFRCDAAYQVPPTTWRVLIDAARELAPDAVFVAETVGGPLELIERLKGVGFDYLYNSSKWWDFRAGWLLDQYERFRHVAPSIAFPESHDTPRLAAELGEIGLDAQLAHYKMRYLFAACFSAGVMMPVGYEYGFTRALNVVETRPDHWEQPRFDLTPFIAAVNRMKAELPALNQEGPLRRVTGSHSPIVGLLRLAGGVGQDGCALILVNPDPHRSHTIVDPGPILGAAGGQLESIEDVTPLATPHALEPGTALTLPPLGVRVFRGVPAAARPVRKPARAEEKASLERLKALASNRVVIESVYPELDGGRFPVKREVGDALEVWADIFRDGHDKIAAAVKWRFATDADWRESPMHFVDNDRWTGTVPLTRNGRYQYTIEAWTDVFETWRAEFVKKRDAGQRVELELIEGRQVIERARDAARERGSEDAARIEAMLEKLSAVEGDLVATTALMLSDELRTLMERAGVRKDLSRYERVLEVWVDRLAARYSAWYEVFPRSAGRVPGRSATFADVERLLPYVRDMGFDVLYFPPIHPIGLTNRKGKNNSLRAEPGEPGSPYAIGSQAGGHKAIHPELGTIEDFHRLVAAAQDHGLEIALDFAIQAAPDHPWIKEHPEWFDWRPDGTIKFAENPPKKYEDIVNVHFYRDAIPGLWFELRDTLLYWVEQGVKIFRVDNPHTKPIPFWEWVIREVQDRHPETLFLAEAFTRPKMMKRLAKAGFTQSYTYFTWRNHKQEITEYLVELTQLEPKEYMRPHFFANTPDILPKILQTGGRPAFMMRAVLAATLSPLYGIYSGFELCEGTPVPGKEEYWNSEKYEYKVWDWDRPGNIRDYIARINRIRHDNPALHELTNLRFHTAWDDNILFYAKMTPQKDNVILVAVNLDPHNAHGAGIEVPLWELGLPDHATVEVEELLSGHRFHWNGKHQSIWLDPNQNPCAIWRVTPPGH